MDTDNIRAAYYRDNYRGGGAFGALVGRQVHVLPVEADRSAWNEYENIKLAERDRLASEYRRLGREGRYAEAIEVVKRVVECDNGRDAEGYRSILHDDYVSYVHGHEQNRGADVEVEALCRDRAPEGEARGSGQGGGGDVEATRRYGDPAPLEGQLHGLGVADVEGGVVEEQTSHRDGPVEAQAWDGASGSVVVQRGVPSVRRP